MLAEAEIGTALRLCKVRNFDSKGRFNLNLLGIDRAIERVELERFDVLWFTPISLRQSLNMPTRSLNVPIFATFPGITPSNFE